MFVSRSKYPIAAVTVISLLAGCTGGSSTPAIAAQAARNQSHVRVQTSSCPCLYVPNFGNSSVTVYAHGANGNVAPVQKITGQRTGLYFPTAIALDASGRMYVTNQSNNSVTVYAAGATGNVFPVQTIIGTYTGLVQPFGIAVNPVNGDIYVSNSEGASNNVGSITIYPANANGNVVPTATIEGVNTDLQSPTGLVLDASGEIYVANSADGGSITVYAAGSTGDAAPIQYIHGRRTKLNATYQVGVDSDLNIYAANTSLSTITVYAAGATGSVSPIRTIKGGATKLFVPDGVALDSGNTIYVANYDGGAKGTGYMTVYAPGANGRVAPIDEIKGAATGISAPAGITVR